MTDHEEDNQASPTKQFYSPDETPMEAGEISSDSELAPSVLEVPNINWAKYLGVKRLQYIKMGHAPRIQALEPNNWNHENTVRETENEFATDLQLLMTETTNDPKLLRTLVCLERKQYDNNPRRTQPVQTKTVNEIRTSFLRRKNYRPDQHANYRYHSLAQRASSHKQDDDGGKTLLVAEAHRRDPKKVRQLHTGKALW